MPPPSQQLAIAEMWTDNELRSQLHLVLWEHRKIPHDKAGAEYDRVIDWYKTVCAEFRRRKMEPELNETVAQYRNRHKHPTESNP